jgi:cobalt/nickel transport system permease protein
MASAFYFLSALFDSGNYTPEKSEVALKGALIIFFRAFTAIMILILLSSTDKIHRLLMALRKLRMPKLICSISALLYRYVFLLADETLRTTRARESRTPGNLRVDRLRVAGNQAAMIFLRSWERSQIIYKSMLSRGFTGEYPDVQKVELKAQDIIFPLIFIALMLIVRLLF